MTKKLTMIELQTRIALLYAEAETKLAAAEAEVRTARRNYERLKELHAKVDGATDREMSGKELAERAKKDGYMAMAKQQHWEPPK